MDEIPEFLEELYRGREDADKSTRSYPLFYGLGYFVARLSSESATKPRTVLALITQSVPALMKYVMDVTHSEREHQQTVFNLEQAKKNAEDNDN